jgi:hypothetical protein
MRKGAAILYLPMAVVLLLFSNGRNTVALAAWLAPLFLLRFVRTQRPGVSLPLAFVALGLTGLPGPGAGA